MTQPILKLLEHYRCATVQDYENALKEIIQEIALLGLWRSKFFDQAAFYGGTALRIMYGLDRFSEDLDFSLLESNPAFSLQPYLAGVEDELASMGFSVTVAQKEKQEKTNIDSAFIKAGTRQHLMKIHLPESTTNLIPKSRILNIKLEIDTDPPGGFSTEAKVLLKPIPFSVNTYQMPDLFAGKLHAILQRNWKNRIKGRDYYDFVWYLARDTNVNLRHLEQRLRQSGAWKSNNSMVRADLVELLQKRFKDLDIEAAKKDVAPFLQDKDAIAIWSTDFFEALIEKVKVQN